MQLIIPYTKTLGGNEDYASGPFTAMFPAGVTHATINIPVVDDNIFEVNETSLYRLICCHFPAMLPF